MALERYNAKRDFKVTAEPPGKLARQQGDLRYVIQKHAASRLHYDFRLELGGVLLSWAVPKGPSLDPADRRLAVHVEDHPVDYGGFEGIIPQGEYGGGSVVVWDRGHWYPEGDDATADYKRGHLKFRLEGEKLHGSFALVRMHGRQRGDDSADNWLLIKHEDEHSDSDGEKLVRERPESIVSGRTVEEIAADPEKVWHSNRGGKKGGPARPSAQEREASARAASKKPAARAASDETSEEERARKRLGLAPRVAAKKVKASSKSAAKRTASAEASASKTGARKTAAKKTSSAETSASKTRARKTAAKKTASAEASASKIGARKTTKKKASSAEASASKTGAKKATAKKATTKKAASKAGAKKTASKAGAKKTASKAGAKKTASKAGAKKTSKQTARANKPAARPGRRAPKTSARKASKRPADEEPGPVVQTPALPATRGRSPLPEKLAPELATLVDEIPPGHEWIHEIKYDGYRLVARIDGPNVALFTRKGEDWSLRFPWLVEALHARVKVKQALLDGELVHLGSDGVTRFGELQAALSDGQHASLVYFAFDLLHLEGHDLRRLPLWQRKQALVGLLPEETRPGRIRLSEYITGQGAPMFTRACRLGLEGVISKHSEAPYRSGRHRDWLKIKCGKRQEVVVGGYTPARSGNREIGSLLLGVYDDAGKLVYCGKVGSGFDFAGAASLRARLDALTQRQSPFSARPPEAGRATYVKPEIVVEIAFTDWTRDGRMRHPVFEGVREDKRPQDVHREKVVPIEAAVADEAPSKPAPTKPTKGRSSGARKGGTAEVLGVAVSHPDRVLYPADGITKRQVAEYYAATAKWMLPFIAGRPISAVRCPEDITKQCFFQKHIHHTLPPGVKTADLGDDAPYLYIEDAEGLIGLTQSGALELHVWGSTIERPDDPDWIVIDLDPDEKVPWARVKETALAVRGRLEDLELESFVKTTGGKGLHVVLPLTPGKQDWDQVKGFSHGIALEFARAAPEMFTANASKAGRSGKIYIDYLRNYRGSTAIAPYSTRARPGATVSVPLRWEELDGLSAPNIYTVENLAARLKGLKKDPWHALKQTRQSLTAQILRSVNRSR